MVNFADLFGKIKEMKVEMEKMKTKLDDVKVEAESGGGMVRVTCNANRKVLGINIDPEIIDKNDKELLEDLVTAAVNRAIDKADQASKEELSKVSGMLPNIPGLDLSKFGM